MDNVPVATQYQDLAGFLGELDRLEAVVAAAEAVPVEVAEAYRCAAENLNGEALRRLVRALRADPAALVVLKAALSDEVVYAVFRRHGIVKPSLDERVEGALDGVRPTLAAHGGDVELVRLAPPVLELRFTGACDGCAASALTFVAVVRSAVQAACPEITDIVQAKRRAA